LSNSVKYLLDEPEGIKSDFLAFCRGRVISDLSFVFEDGDEIAFYPPVTCNLVTPSIFWSIFMIDLIHGSID